MKGARHWDWLGQALDAGFDKPIMSKEQLLLERRQRLQGKIHQQVSWSGLYLRTDIVVQ